MSNTNDMTIPETGLIPVTIKDQLGNEYLLHAFKEAPFGLIALLNDFQTETDPAKQIGAINAVFTMAFPEAQAEMLANLTRAPGGPSLKTVMELFQTLMEKWFDRPTSGPSESSPSDGSTTTPSEDASQPQEATPTVSIPETGLPPVTSY